MELRRWWLYFHDFRRFEDEKLLQESQEASRGWWNRFSAFACRDLFLLSTFSSGSSATMTLKWVCKTDDKETKWIFKEQEDYLRVFVRQRFISDQELKWKMIGEVRFIVAILVSNDMESENERYQVNTKSKLLIGSIIDTSLRLEISRAQQQ
jgi:hypothetical protein